jgi:hypothetical protein
MFDRRRGSSPRSLAAGLAVALASLHACTRASEPASSEPASSKPASSEQVVPDPARIDEPAREPEPEPEPELEPPSEVQAPPPDPAPGEEPAGPKPAAKGARRGAVCQTGTRPAIDEDGKTREPVRRDCQAGLQCCYPCGIAGCDWICATPTECSAWRTRP